MSAAAWVSLLLPVALFLGALFLVSRKTKDQASSTTRPAERDEP